MTGARFGADALVDFATSLLTQSGVARRHRARRRRRADTGDLLGHTTHGLHLLAPYLAEIEKGAMTKSGEPTVVNARAASETWDGQRLPGTWLTLRALDRAAAMAATERHRHRRHPPLASHRVPRRLSAARDGARARRDRPELGSDGLRRGSSRRHHAGHHAESDRRRLADIGRSDPDRHLELDHEHGVRDPAEERRQEAARRVADRQPGQRDRRSRCAFHRSSRRAAAVGRARRRLQGLRADAPRRSADGGTLRLRPRRSARGLGRHGVRAGLRPGSFRRNRRVPAADGSHGRNHARIEAAPGRRARAASRRGGDAPAARAARERRRALSDDHAGARAVGGEARRRTAGDSALRESR